MSPLKNFTLTYTGRYLFTITIGNYLAPTMFNLSGFKDYLCIGCKSSLVGVKVILNFYISIVDILLLSYLNGLGFLGNSN